MHDMSDYSPIFKRFPEKYKRGTFQQILEGFKSWNRTGVVTDKQTKMLAVESNISGKKATNVRVQYKNKKGKTQTRWKDVITGQFMKSENEESILPLWRAKDTKYKKGILTNLETGERLKIRNSKGRMLPKSEWTLTDKKGKVIKLAPPEEKTPRLSDSERARRVSLRRAQREAKTKEYSEKLTSKKKG